MFERFSDDANQAIVLASDEARTLGHNWIGTEHLLLGLLRGGDTTACEVLASLGVRIDAARSDVIRRLGDPDPEKPPGAQIPFTPRVKKVLELALREALSLGSNEIGTEHILLGLTREGQGIANQVLDDLGADAETIRAATLAARPSARERRRERRAVRMGPSPSHWEYRIERPDAGTLEVATLNDIGEDGWELTSVLPAELGGGLVFKRQVRLPGARYVQPETRPRAPSDPPAAEPEPGAP